MEEKKVSKSLHISTKKVPPYFYRDRRDLEEILLESTVAEIGEGAFFRCTFLRKITVGRGVGQIGPSAFSRIARNAEFIWLGKAPYKSGFMRLLPPFSDIRGICAPYVSFEKAGEEEKLVLAIGFVLHPEYEECYPEAQKALYNQYIREKLTGQAARLCEKECIFEVIEALWQRSYPAAVRNSADNGSNERLSDKAAMAGQEMSPKKNCLEGKELKQLLSYARSQRTSRERKKMLDRIEREAGLTDGKEDVFSETYELDKRILRQIWEQVTDSSLRIAMEQAGIRELPEVSSWKESRNADTWIVGEDIPERSIPEPENVLSTENSRSVVPPDILKFILYSYMKQYQPASPLGEFFPVDFADQLVDCLDRQEFSRLLGSLGPVVRDRGDGKKEILYPQRLIPILRYADDTLCAYYAARWEAWKDYDVYGASGNIAAEILTRAMLLNRGEEALIFAGRTGNLEKYAGRYGKSSQEWFWILIGLLEERKRQGRDKALAPDRLMQSYRGMIYDAFVSGKDVSYEEFCRTRLQSPTVRRLLRGLVFTNGRSLFVLHPDHRILIDLKKNSQPLPGDMISLAHPCRLSQYEIRRLLDAGPISCMQGERGFSQIYEIDCICSPRDYDSWRDRYKNLQVSRKAVMSLPGMVPAEAGYVLCLEGSPDRSIRISYGKRVILIADALPDGKMQLGEMQMQAFTDRELQEVLHLLDDAFCMELLLCGRLGVRPYLDHFDDVQLEEILQASIACERLDNVALLLDRLRGERKEDEELEW